jgi:elongation factor Tu
MLELVELEMREILSEYGYDGENTPIVTSRWALEDKDHQIGSDSIFKLLEVPEVDRWIYNSLREMWTHLSCYLLDSISGVGTAVKVGLNEG